MNKSNRTSLLAAAAMLGVVGSGFIPSGEGYSGPSRYALPRRGAEQGWTPSKRVGSKRRKQHHPKSGGQGGKHK